MHVDCRLLMRVIIRRKNGKYFTLFSSSIAGLLTSCLIPHYTFALCRVINQLKVNYFKLLMRFSHVKSNLTAMHKMIKNRKPYNVRAGSIFEKKLKNGVKIACYY